MLHHMWVIVKVDRGRSGLVNIRHLATHGADGDAERLEIIWMAPIPLDERDLVQPSSVVHLTGVASARPSGDKPLAAVRDVTRLSAAIIRPVGQRAHVLQDVVDCSPRRIVEIEVEAKQQPARRTKVAFPRHTMAQSRGTWAFICACRCISWTQGIPTRSFGILHTSSCPVYRTRTLIRMDLRRSKELGSLSFTRLDDLP